MSDQESGEWDAIVIGSGIGGMAAAAALSRVGQRVLLLEQHWTLGGLTHSFTREGFTWDVGLHYLSYMAPDERERRLLDWLCDTPLELVSLGAIYDVLHIGSAEPLSLSRPYAAQERDLKDRFPDEAEAIEAWTQALREGRETLLKVAPTRAMPELAGDILDWWNRHAIEKWCDRTTQQVIDSFTENPELAAAMAAQWGDHGGRPSKSSFAMHAMVAASYLSSGSWYPVGGASAFAEHIIPTITKAGGEARAGVRVESLLFDAGQVVGVRTDAGEEMRANVVISDIGARETVDSFLAGKEEYRDWIAQVHALPASIAHFTLFLGFEGDIEAAGATTANHWFYPTGDVDVVWETAPDGDPPFFAIAFGSLKNPSHDPGPRQKHTGQLLTWVDWDCVAPWANTPQGNRGADYEDFKGRVKATLLAQFKQRFPELAKLVVYSEVATPLATVSFTGHHHGAFYGIDVTPERVASDALRAKTPVPGLYLAGQDVVTPGIPGALWGGILSAASVNPRVFQQFRK